MGRGFRLMTVAGIRIMIHPSWFVIFALVVASLGGYADVNTDQLSVAGRWSVAVLVAALFFASVLAHELAHALVARRRGLAVDQITLFLFGGAASLEQEAPSALTEGLVAVAGPISSAVIGMLFLFGTVLLADVNTGWAGVAYWACFWLGLSNLVLCVFNLVPGFPLDGGRVLRAIAWAITKDFMRATKIASIVGRVTGQLIVVAGLFMALAGGSGAIIDGIWLVMIGWFLSRAASYSYKQAALERLVEGIKVGDVMETNVPVIGPNLTLDVLADQRLMAGQAGFYAVVSGGELIGTIDLPQIRRVGRGRWTTTRVGEVMSRGDAIVTLTEPQPVMDAVSRFERSTAPAFAVVDVHDARRLLGMITREGLFKALQARSRLTAGAASQ